jgi:hypothetical protein
MGKVKIPLIGAVSVPVALVAGWIIYRWYNNQPMIPSFAGVGAFSNRAIPGINTANNVRLNGVGAFVLPY